MTNPRQLLKKIKEQEFVDKVLNDAVIISSQLYDSSSTLKINPEPIRSISEYEFYVTKCGTSFSHLFTLLEQIVMLPAYIEEYRLTKSMRRYKITRLYDISYHYENYIIRIKSIEDRILHLCNSIFHLGLDGRDVKYYTLYRNNHIKSNEIKMILKEIHDYCDKHGSSRNKIMGV